MYRPDFKDFHRYEVPVVTEAVRKSESKPFSSIGTDDTGNMKELSLVCYQCVGKARRDVTNHGMCSAQSSSNYTVRIRDTRQQVGVEPPVSLNAIRFETVRAALGRRCSNFQHQ